MLKNGKQIKRQRKFSKDFKLKIVKNYESGSYSIQEISKFYDITRANHFLFKIVIQFVVERKNHIKIKFK